MSEGKNIIEVNGKRYDARTGKLLSGTVAPKPTPTPIKQPGVALDGFNTKRQVARNLSQTAHAVHAKTTKSQTLMRHAVKKPVAAPKPTLKAAVALDSIQKPKRVSLGSQTVIAPSPERVARAEQVAKSTMVSKFSFGLPTITKQVAPLAVKDVPAQLDTSARPVTQINPFQSAIDNATSHTQPKTKKRRNTNRVARKLGISNQVFAATTATVAVMLIGGFISYRHVPSVAMRVASAKAGVRGNVPAYHPSGFNVSGPIKYSPGEIALSYQSTTDQRNFKITQRVSNWDNDSLIKNFVATNNRSYQVLQKNDKTIYLYDGSSATWIDHGVWYQIEGTSDLSSDQLIRIADSL